MADALTVASAAKWIAASLIQEGKYLYGVEDLVRELQEDLECMQELLQKVDEDPGLVKEDGQLRIFTHKLRELAFRAEDAIDTYVVDVGAKVYTKCFLVKLACLLSHSYPLHILRNEIEAIKHEIKKAEERFKTYGMIVHQQNLPGSSFRRQKNYYVPSENYVHLDEVVVGIDDIVSQLVERLTDPNDDFKVLGIFGTGGAGKSTLATQLYRHTKVSSLFPHKAFVSVSQQWSRSDLLRRIFKQIKGDKEEVPSTESELVKNLHAFIKDNRCLVVLDDVWRTEALADVYPIFPLTGEFGYRVIVTTRNKEVPLSIGTKCITHEPKLLTEDQKWELFRKVAMEGSPQIKENSDQYEKLGRQMLKECPGLPLAVVTLAGILRTKRELYEWKEISKACRGIILKGKRSSNYGDVKDMLELSYLDLPPHLKSCFLYLSIFPEDEEIRALFLIPLWIAEGFITSDLLVNEREILEDAGLRLLNELARRCIIQVLHRNTRGQIESFRVHDLMRDFCVKKAEESQFSGTVSTTRAEARGPSRRLRIQSWGGNVVENRSVRSIIEIEEPDELVCDEVIMVRHSEQVGRCKLLRVLFIQSCPVLKCIGKLIHLRLLCLNIWSSREIPKSIKNLRNLLYLRLVSDCYVNEEVELPNDLVCKMQNLRELGLEFELTPGSRCLNTSRSLGVKGLKNLQALSSGAGKWMMNELPTLSLTVHEICIYDIKTTEEIDALYLCPSFVEGRLRKLECSFAKYLEFDLKKLSQCRTLWSLFLRSCTLMGAPEFPPSLMELWLVKSKMAKGEYDYDLMQVLGELSHLKILSLRYIENCGKVLSCKAGAFPQLQELELDSLGDLEEWVMEEGAMPRLTKLTLGWCKALKRLPQSIQSITTIKELELNFMSEEFFARLGYGASGAVGEDSHIIQHIPSVKIFNP